VSVYSIKRRDAGVLYEKKIEKTILWAALVVGSVFAAPEKEKPVPR